MHHQSTDTRMMAYFKKKAQSSNISALKKKKKHAARLPNKKANETKKRWVNFYHIWTESTRLSEHDGNHQFLLITFFSDRWIASLLKCDLAKTVKIIIASLNVHDKTKNVFMETKLVAKRCKMCRFSSSYDIKKILF